MPSPNMRVPVETLDTLRQLAQETGSSMQEVLEMAVDNFKRQMLLNLANESYAALQANSELRESRDQERAARGVLEQDRLEREQREPRTPETPPRPETGPRRRTAKSAGQLVAGPSHQTASS